jgi:hypothetical protein
MSVVIKIKRDYGLHLVSEWETDSAGQFPSIETMLNTELWLRLEILYVCSMHYVTTMWQVMSRASRLTRRGPRPFPGQSVRAGSSAVLVLGLIFLSHVSSSCALAIAPVVSKEQRLDRVSQLVSAALGDTQENPAVYCGGGTKLYRYDRARNAGWEFGGRTLH